VNNTKIEWADDTWNPVTGCLHGCEYCYARKIAKRFAGLEPRCGGEDIPLDKRKYGENSIWNTTHNEALHIFSKQPIRRTKSGKFQKANFPYDFEPTFHRYRLGEPVHRRSGRNIFVCSMADMFGEWVPDEWIQAVFDACEVAPQHKYLFLTKNPKRYISLVEKGILRERENFWCGSSVPTPETEFFWHDQVKTFISIEPLLKPFNLLDETRIEAMKKINWIIIGAETGIQKGKVKPEASWIYDIVEAADASQTPVFMKDSLIPIIGVENMRRDFPDELKKGFEDNGSPT
jgi:Bacteriophage protein gp37